VWASRRTSKPSDVDYKAQEAHMQPLAPPVPPLVALKEAEEGVHPEE
jgi:hypothetical protein